MKPKFFITNLAILFIAVSVPEAAFARPSDIVESDSVEMLDLEIARLQKELDAYQKEELIDISEGQRYMIADWSAYSREIKEAKANDMKAKDLEQQISKLKERRQQLLQRK